MLPLQKYLTLFVCSLSPATFIWWSFFAGKDRESLLHIHSMLLRLVFPLQPVQRDLKTGGFPSINHSLQEACCTPLPFWPPFQQLFQCPGSAGTRRPAPVQQPPCRHTVGSCSATSPHISSYSIPLLFLVTFFSFFSSLILYTEFARIIMLIMSST